MRVESKQQHCLGGHSVRASAMGRIMKATEDWGNMHVWGSVPVDTGREMGIGKFQCWCNSEESPFILCFCVSRRR